MKKVCFESTTYGSNVVDFVILLKVDKKISVISNQIANYVSG